MPAAPRSLPPWAIGVLQQLKTENRRLREQVAAKDAALDELLAALGRARGNGTAAAPGDRKPRERRKTDTWPRAECTIPSAEGSCWAKLVTGTFPGRTGGLAVRGGRLTPGITLRLRIGTLVLFVEETAARLYTLAADGLQETYAVGRDIVEDPHAWTQWVLPKIRELLRLQPWYDPERDSPDETARPDGAAEPTATAAPPGEPRAEPSPATDGAARRRAAAVRLNELRDREDPVLRAVQRAPKYRGLGPVELLAAWERERDPATRTLVTEILSS